MNMRAKATLLLLLNAALWTGSTLVLAQDSLLITEFMAANDNSVKDDLGEFSDWIEIYNNGTNTVNLGGHYLTDEQSNPAKWQFPATNLAPQRFLVVYASGLNRVTPGKPFHTNFKLSAAGDYLGLVRPDGITVVHEFAPVYPPQQEGLTYGAAVEDLKTVPLVAPGVEARVLIPTNSISTAWSQPEFDHGSWLKAKTALKFDLSTGPLGYDNLPGTDLETVMHGKSSTAYVRIPFDGGELTAMNDFQLLVRFDDGFVAYLNGQEVARRSAPAALQWNSAATSVRSNALALVSERIHLNDRQELLRSSGNVLAIQALNRTAGDGDFLMLPEIVVRQTKVLTQVYRFFDVPTPGGANTPGLPGTAGAVRFSRTSATFVSPFQLELEPAQGRPGAVVRYTLDRSLPMEFSPVYSAPLQISNSVQVRARAFAPGVFPGPVKTESYIALSSNVLNFTSDLPILVIHSFGGGRVNGANYAPAFMTIHEPVRGRSSLTNAPHAHTRAGFKDRGSSTANQVKPNYAVEIWDEENQPEDFSILGMPADPDWVFHAPYNWDPALIRNPLAFALGHKTGRYAPRYRFVEVYANAGATTGPISAAHYAGVYNILEKVKRDPSRVDIDELHAGDSQPPEVTGGYIMKIDRLDPTDSGLSAGGRQVALVEPKEAEIKSPERLAQRNYLTGYLNAFNTALNGANFAHPTLGYAPYVDAGAWIDFHIVDTLTWNVDALVLSSFFYKPRNGPLVYGPLWDYDRSLGSQDSRDDLPRTWGGNFFTTQWWARMFRDTNFWQRWGDRWQDLREGEFSNPELLGLIDSLAAQVAESAPRDFAKWRQPKRGNTQAGEINFLKNWFTNRLDFFDTNFVSKPLFSRVGGPLFPGFKLTMAALDGAAIYYTLDGSDPRLSNGQISPSAAAYSGPVALGASTTVRARAYKPGHRSLGGPPVSTPWSSLTQARYSAEAPATPGSLIITEVHYNPAGPSDRELAVNAAFQDDDFEFLELKNIGREAIDLHGASFRRGIEFSFASSSLVTLAPGQHLVVVRNRSAFEARYGNRLRVAGEFKGSLDNNGEPIEIVDADGRPIVEFEYRDSWHPVTDGHGFSLVLADESARSGRLSLKSGWRPSAQSNGSPGGDDPAPPALPRVVISEILVFSREKDAVELFNASGGAANIGGWFLTDDLGTPKKFRLPDGTSIPAGGYRVFTEDDLSAVADRRASLSFSRFGEQIYLFSADGAGNLQWYSHGFSFGGAEEEISLGRYLTTTGEEHLVPQISRTLQATNAGSKVGPVVINEIMYHPPDVLANQHFWDNDEDEFIELHNITGQPVPLFDPLHASNTWSLRGAVDFDFPTNQTIPPQGYLLLVGFDPGAKAAQLAAFRSRYSGASNSVVLGPFNGKLGNRAGAVRLFKPGAPEGSDASNANKIPSILVDAVDYAGETPWPIAADGLGHSLQRIKSGQYGNDPVNWSDSAPTPGGANRREPPPTILRQPVDQTVVAGSTVTIQVNATGTGPLAYRWRAKGQNVAGATNSALTLSGVEIADAGDYQAVVLNGGSSISSARANLTVLKPATIVRQPVGKNVSPGGSATLAVSARVSGPASFQWRRDGSVLPGETNASLVLANVRMAQAGAYTVLVSDPIGSSISEPALIKVAPELLSQPQGQEALVGDTVILRAAATGTPPLSFRWRRDGVSLSNGTNDTLILTDVQLGDAGTYTVAITNIASARIALVSQDAPVFVWADFDKDRMADLWEAAHGFATNYAADALLDTDGDGLTNRQEYEAGTDPTDQHDRFRIDSIKANAGLLEMQFLARSNKSYTVQFKEPIDASSWITLTNIPRRGTNRMESVQDPLPTTSSRFYRLLTPAVP
ncbi:MAG: lamin tail domain-containing protein [Verrucomicrobia bacterium]|nr:lamin tail domain-containing protein [Verrucomicrobiota bacterium]